MPKAIASEEELYTLQHGTSANGLTGAQLESTLAGEVDNRIVDIRKRASAACACGVVTDQALATELTWLMQTFIARAPVAILRAENAVVALVAQERERIESVMARAQLESSRQGLRNYLDPRMPRTAARAGVAAVARADAPKRWPDADVHVVKFEQVEQALRAIGAGEFVTFDDPVVEWEPEAAGPLASFAWSPKIMLMFFPAGATPTAATYAEVAIRHALAPLETRENLICRTPIVGALLEAASSLRLSRIVI